MKYRICLFLYLTCLVSSSKYSWINIVKYKMNYGLDNWAFLTYNEHEFSLDEDFELHYWNLANGDNYSFYWDF